MCYNCAFDVGLRAKKITREKFDADMAKKKDSVGKMIPGDTVLSIPHTHQASLTPGKAYELAMWSPSEGTHGQQVGEAVLHVSLQGSLSSSIINVVLRGTISTVPSGPPLHATRAEASRLHAVDVTECSASCSADPRHR